MMKEPIDNTMHDWPVFVVALTGGIASGKTTVSDLFAELGVPIIDTDLIARDLVEPGQPLLSSIVATFGQELLDAYGRLKRRKLRDLIFNNREKRRQLDALMHPEIAVEARRRIKAVDTGYCILVIPLLKEKDGYAGIDRVLVVDTAPETQIKRLSTRDDVSRAQAESALAAQTTRQQRLEIADDIISNSGLEEELRHKVQDLHQFYLYLCASKSNREHEPQ
jgi:dephospho-CoA kinase